jgi:hypothetical protein
MLPEVVAARPTCSVKDSFAALDLVPYGFHVRFDARWIAHEKARAPATTWSRVTTVADLGRWKAAHGDSPAISAGLLTDPDVALLVDESWTMGLIANRSSTVVGISNVYGTAAAWTEGAAAASGVFPGLPLVGWERGETLQAALAAGWDELGPLRVWLLGTQGQPA